MTTEGLTRYFNDVQTALYLGWRDHEEYCVGDTKNAKFVTHDTKNGLWWFHD